MAQHASPVKVNRKPLKKRICENWQIYLFLLVPVTCLILFTYLPMVGIQIAFRKYTIRGGLWGSKWVGFYQFSRFLKSYRFFNVLRNTLVLSVYGIITTFPMPILFALMLNCVRQPRYKRFIQTVSYMPHFISIIVLVSMITQMSNPRVGIYGILYHALTGSYPPDPLGSPSVFVHLYTWSGVWQSFGYASIIYMAALTNVSPELHEAAMIDGASRFRRVLHVDLPAIVPTICILLIMRAGSILTVGYEKTFLMQNSLNLSASEVISPYTYKLSLGAGAGVPDYSYAAAIDLLNSVVNTAMLLSVNAIVGKLSDNSLW